jgi:hypothetical protein
MSHDIPAFSTPPKPSIFDRPSQFGRRLSRQNTERTRYGLPAWPTGRRIEQEPEVTSLPTTATTDLLRAVCGLSEEQTHHVAALADTHDADLELASVRSFPQEKASPEFGAPYGLLAFCALIAAVVVAL